MGDGPWAHAECVSCGEEWEGSHALMVGKNHAKHHGHEVMWTQENTGLWDYTDD